MLSPLLRHLLSEEQGRTEWTGTGDREWAVHRHRRGGGGGGSGGSGGFERYATAVVDMHDYDRRDINVSVEDGKVIVHGSRREGDDSSFEAHETRRSLELPAEADASQLRYAKARGVVNLEVPLAKISRSGGRRHRSDERRLTVEHRRRATDDDVGEPLPGGDASAATDAAGAEAMGLWRQRDEASATYSLRVPAPGFCASNLEVILVEGKAIVKGLIKDSDGMRSMRHSFVVPALLDAGRMTAEFVAAPTGHGGVLLLTAPKVYSYASSGGGGLEQGIGEVSAATQQQLSPENALAGGGGGGGGGGAPDVKAAAADRSAQQSSSVEAESLEGISFPQPPADSLATPTADAASASSEAAGAWPLTKSPFELGLEPPPYAAAAGESAAADERLPRRPSPPHGGEAAGALGAGISGEENQLKQQPPLHELMVPRYRHEEGSLASAPWSTGVDEPSAVGSERSPEAAAWPPMSNAAGGGGEAEGGAWPPEKSPFEQGVEQSQPAAAADEKSAGDAGASDERWWPFPPSGEAPASASTATTSKGSDVAQQQQQALSTPPPSPLHDVQLESPEEQPAAAVGEPASGDADVAGAGAVHAWQTMRSPVDEQSESAGGAAAGVGNLPRLPSVEAVAPETAPLPSGEAVAPEAPPPPSGETSSTTYTKVRPLPPLRSFLREAGGGVSDQQNTVGEAERREVGLETPAIGLDEKLQRPPQAQAEVEQPPKAQDDAPDVEKHRPVVVGSRRAQLYVIGGEEREDAARSEARGDHKENADRRSEEEEVSAGGTADTGTVDAGGVYVPGAYTIRSGQRGFASQAIPTPEKAAAAAGERSYGHPSGGDGGRSHHRATAGEEGSYGHPSGGDGGRSHHRSTAGEESVPRDAGHAKAFDVAATQQEMRRAHELGGA